MQPRPQHLKLLNGKTPAALYVSPLKVLLLHVTCALGLASAFWAANHFYALALVKNPAQTLRIIWVVEASVVILVYSLFRHNPDQCSYLKAIARGWLGLPAGAIVNALAAIVLGAPVGIQHFRKTIHWSMLMSIFTFVPAASVFGSSWTDWHRIFAHTESGQFA